MKTNLIFWAILAWLCFAQSLSAQPKVIFNKPWLEKLGSPKNNRWLTSVLDIHGNLITVGNIDNTTSGHADLYVAKQSASGGITWEKTFSLSNSDCYGIGVTTDSSGNIFISGTVKDNSSNFDYLILKYDTSGTQIWHAQLDGTGNGDDIPTGITCTTDGDRVFVSGLSTGLGTLYDYWTIAFNGINGVVGWSKRYDYGNSYDAPAAIRLDLQGFLYVTGISFSATSRNLATIKYASNGTLVSENRFSNSNIGVYLPSWMDVDNAGNIYITGMSSSNNINFDINTIKINANFTLGWQKAVDNSATVDSATVVKVDANGNTFVLGYYSKSGGGKDGIILKYDNNGVLLWQKLISSPKQNSWVIPRLIEIKNDNIIIACEVLTGSSSVIRIAQYMQNGSLIGTEESIFWQKNSKNIPSSINIDNFGDILVSALNESASSKTYFSFKLTPYVISNSSAYINNQESHIKREILVMFKPGTVNSSFINNTNIRVGKVQDALDATIINEIQNKLAANDVSMWSLVKMHPNMTLADSITTSYSGEQIHIPPFYNNLMLIIPDSFARIAGEFAISDTLNSIGLSCYILKTSPNAIFHSDACEPNDPKYIQQSSLHGTSAYPNGSINIEDAWCIAGGGSSNVKVAIADFSGLYWQHEDFGNGTFSGSVISGGYNYYNNSSNPEDLFDGGYHGTQVGSIIGSIRNNGIGVSGICGGSGSGDGARLLAYKMKTIFEFGNVIEKTINEYQPKVLNISAGTASNFYGPDFLRPYLYFANRMGMTICASRGNNSTDDLHFPATSQPEWVISVSGTNQDGNFNTVSSFGLGVDVAAPSVTALVETAYVNAVNGYASFSGTSAAAPHVAGLAALIQSYYNGELTPDDIDYIIKKSASPIPPVPNAKTGYGKLNAGNALKMIKKPDCGVFHFYFDSSTSGNNYTLTDITPSSSSSLFLPEEAYKSNGFAFPACSYKLKHAYQIDASVQHNIPTGYLVKDYWPDNSTSNTFAKYTGVAPYYKLNPAQSVQIISLNELSAQIRGYYYEIMDQSCGINGNMLDLPIHMSYSVLACAITSTDEPLSNDINIFPNPTPGLVSINLKESDLKISSLRVFDCIGNEVLNTQIDSSMEENIVDLSAFSSGIYIFTFYGSDLCFSKKVSKF